MGATSVTGVSGPGSVSGINKGSEHMSLGVERLIGPRVVAAGTKTLTSTTGTVVIPALSGVVGDYVVMVSANTSAHVYVSTAMAAVSDTGDWSFIITGGSGALVNWTIVKTGLTYVPVQDGSH